MRWAGYLFALLATVSTIRSQEYPDEVVSHLIFPDGSLPDLLPRQTGVPKTWKAQTTAERPTTCADTPTTVKIDPKWRLSRDALPTHYRLDLDVNVEKFVFSGVVKITVRPQKTVEKITLHSDGLIVKKAEISQLSMSYLLTDWGSVRSVTEDKLHQTATFHLSKALEPGYNYELKIEYDGEIRNDLYGFYRSSYKVQNETRWLATTQFEPVYARRAFPCFDEPNMKAKFIIRITHDKKYSALSNMPIDTSTSKNDRVTDLFKETPNMSTYLVAFIISDYQSYKTEDPISSVWANEHYIKDAKFSQEIGVKTVRNMEDFTNINFSLPKIDHVAIPDFAAGAMENWGLITYRDYQLIKTNQSDTPTTQSIVALMAHEVAHQWFGNLVTLDWWSYTWLNEGFATFFETFVTENITQGKFRMWQQFVPSKFQVALGSDGNPSTSVAMTSNASTPQEIAAKFDQISYGKGGSILRMISELLSLDKFQEGLRNYLNKKQYSNAKPADLFEEWEKVSSGKLPQGVKFTDFAKSWTEQDGVPVVNASRNYETGQVTFTQQRYYEKKSNRSSDYNRRWWIPLTWISQFDRPNLDQFKPQAWLRGDVKDEKYVLNTTMDYWHWFLVNPRSVGYYRINYDRQNWITLAKSLIENPQDFPVENRAQILNDAFFLASSDYVDFGAALETLNFLAGERDASVWMSATRILSRLFDEMGSAPMYSFFEKFWRQVLTGVYRTVRLQVNPNEEHTKSLLRYYVAPWACLFGVPQCLKDAEENLRQHEFDLNSIHPDVVSPTFCGAVRGANETTFWNIRKLVSTVDRKDLQQKITSALGRCHPNINLIEQHLKETLKDDSTFPKDLRLTAIQQVMTSPSKWGVGFEFLRVNRPRVSEVFGKEHLTELVRLLIKRLRTERHHIWVGEYIYYIAPQLTNPEKVIAELEAAISNTEWYMKHGVDVSSWFISTLDR